MECGTSPRDGSPPHDGRREKNQRGDSKRNSREGKLLTDATGRYSSPPIRRQQGGNLLYFGTQKDVRCLRTVPHEQVSFITGARSVDKQDLSKNLKFFRVTAASINSIYSKLAMKVFDVCANILK
jgi:hypothetical protein